MNELESMIVGVVLESDDYADSVKAKFDEYIDEDAFENRVIDIIKDNVEEPEVDDRQIRTVIDDHIGDVDEIRQELTHLKNELILSRCIINDLQERVDILELETTEIEEEPQKSFLWDFLPIALGVLAGQFLWALFN